MYVKVTNGSVNQYPYTIGQLRRDNSNTSFPRQISSALLESYGVYEVTTADAPSYDEKTQKVELHETPTLVDGYLVLNWSVINKTEDEVAEYNAFKSEDNTIIRNNKLLETDWWALSDTATMTDEQTAYRQALRDITSHANWPHLESADWPTKPS